MTPEERAEAYILREDVVTENDRVPVDNGYGWQTVSFEDEVKKGYLDGYKQGYEDCKPKWHDLKKNPNDLPKEGVEVLVLYSNTYDDKGLVVNKHTLRYELAQYINDEEDLTEWYWVESGLDDMVHEVIAWRELPKFKE